jgi:hypothetical protein
VSRSIAQLTSRRPILQWELATTAESRIERFPVVKSRSQFDYV